MRPPRLSRDLLLRETLRLLEEGGLRAVTMRALAQRLGIDPMAAYHYFPDKDALLRAAAARAYERMRVPRLPRASWRARLESLARAYLAMLARSRELLRYVTAHAATTARAPAAIFDAHFRDAIEPLRLPPRTREIAQHAFVDFLHGVALAGRVPWPRVRAELRVIIEGIAGAR